MRIAIVGATGLVGSMILKVLEERKFPITDLITVASSKSVGRKIIFRNNEYVIVDIETAVSLKPQIAIFSAGSTVSTEWAPKFAENGTIVVDNSSAWRMDSDKKLIIPEINAKLLTKNDKIIANPNCSTIQMLMVLAPLHREYRVKRVVVSTYQSVTGTGAKALKQMENERDNIEAEKAYPYPIDRNCLPHCDVFLENGYTKEEMKMVNETQKILNDNNIQLTATAVRVPVMGGHSESINIELEKDFKITDVVCLLSKTKGIEIKDDPKNNVYPMPLFAQNTDEVYVGRIRRDYSHENSLNMWVVSDNLRKGAATNAVQIAEYLVKEKYV